jgi:hypothetical protein
MDGNFSAVHQQGANTHQDIKLTHGKLFMTESTNYKAHLALAKEVKEVYHMFHVHLVCWLSTLQKPTCDEHHTVNDWFVKYKGLNVSGIGATACSCHGCFCPGAVVNFQNGERYALGI